MVVSSSTEGKDENSSGLVVRIATMITIRPVIRLKVNNTSSRKAGSGITSMAMITMTSSGMPSSPTLMPRMFWRKFDSASELIVFRSGDIRKLLFLLDFFLPHPAVREHLSKRCAKPRTRPRPNRAAAGRQPARSRPAKAVMVLAVCDAGSLRGPCSLPRDFYARFATCT